MPHYSEDDREQLHEIVSFLNKVQEGGKIVASANLTTVEWMEARTNNRILSVGGLGFVYIPESDCDHVVAIEEKK